MLKAKLLEAQKLNQMCIHKEELSELDIHNRILRYKNYMVALVHRNILPFHHQVISEILTYEGFQYQQITKYFYLDFFKHIWHSLRILSLGGGISYSKIYNDHSEFIMIKFRKK